MLDAFDVEVADVIGDDAAKERMLGPILQPRRHDGERAVVDVGGSAPDIGRCCGGQSRPAQSRQLVSMASSMRW
jgi:hypothetical protein